MKSSAKLSEFLAKWPVYLLACLIFMAFAVLVLPAKSREIATYTPEGGQFDTAYLYTPAEVAEKAGRYTAEGRAAYIKDRWTFDLAFPAVYGFFMLSSWAFGLRGLFGLRRARQALGRQDDTLYRWPAWLLFIPLAGIVFDLAENTAVTFVMLAWPDISFPLALAASLGTGLKWLFVFPGFGGAVLLPLLYALCSLARRIAKV
ncbi:MAG: hypothetical protein KKI09_13380 [Spirochaetes bacterium]|nr:hypothetical protein [Spirochaetota bacterium]